MPQRVFILRPDHLGDVILFSGALEPLRKKWPAAEMVFCGQESALSLLEHCPFIDRFIPFRQLEADALCLRVLSWLPGAGTAGRVARVVRAFCQPWTRRKYASDIVLLPLRSPHYLYHLEMDFIPAPCKLGIDDRRPNSNPPPEAPIPGYSSRLQSGHWPADFPELELNRKFLEFVGCDPGAGDLRPRFWTAPADVQFAREHIKGDDRGLIIGLAPGVQSNPAKQLSPDWYNQVFQCLGAVPCHLIAFGTGVEKEYCDAVLASLAGLPQVLSTRNLAGETTPRQLVECIRLCQVFLSQETAALHTAVALNIPVAGIVGGGHFGRFFPWGSPHLVHPIYNPHLDCFGCDWVCRQPSLRCLLEINPLDAARQLNSAIACAGRVAL